MVQCKYIVACWTCKRIGQKKERQIDANYNLDKCVSPFQDMHGNRKYALQFNKIRVII